MHNAGNRFTQVVQHHNIKKRGKNNNKELALVDHECLTLKSNVNGGLELLHRDMREIPSPNFWYTLCVKHSCKRMCVSGLPIYIVGQKALSLSYVVVHSFPFWLVLSGAEIKCTVHVSLHCKCLQANDR